MLLRIAIHIIFLTLPVYLLAQTESDSIYLYEYQKEIYKRNFLQHNLSSPESFGEVNLDYSFQKGNRRLAQQAYERSAADFYALGANQLGNFRISGDFLFNKIFEDSLANGQRNDIDKWSPFQYYASKAGKYERQNYKAYLTLSYKWKWGLQPFFNANYLYHWTTGSVDPRFDSKKFEFKYNPGIILNRPPYSLGINAILGKGNEKIGITYKNKTYQSSLLYPDRIHYLNMGYGYINIKDSVTTNKYSNIYGAQLSFNTKTSSSDFDLNVRFERKDEDNTNSLKSNKVYSARSIYVEDIFDAKATLQLHRSFSHHLFLLNTTYIKGKDGHIDFSPSRDLVNYSIEYMESKLSYLYTRKREKPWNYDLGLDVNYFSIDRKDFATNLAVNNSFVQIAPTFRLRNNASGKDMLQLSFNPVYQQNINNALQFSPNSTNTFLQGVVFWDYDYYATNALNLDWNIKWTTRRINNNYLIGVQTNYTFAKNIGAVHEQSSSFANNATRNYFMIGVYLYL